MQAPDLQPCPANAAPDQYVAEGDSKLRFGITRPDTLLLDVFVHMIE